MNLKSKMDTLVRESAAPFDAEAQYGFQTSFAPEPDSPVEERGFEPSVPSREGVTSSREPEGPEIDWCPPLAYD